MDRAGRIKEAGRRTTIYRPIGVQALREDLPSKYRRSVTQGRSHPEQPHMKGRRAPGGYAREGRAFAGFTCQARTSREPRADWRPAPPRRSLTFLR